MIAEVKIKQVYDATIVISTLAGLSMIILSAYFMVVLYNLYHVCSDPSQECPALTFDKFMTILGAVSGLFYCILTIGLIIAFISLNRAITKRYNENQIRSISKTINGLFCVLVISYSLRTVFLLGQGQYQYIV